MITNVFSVNIFAVLEVFNKELFLGITIGHLLAALVALAAVAVMTVYIIHDIKKGGKSKGGAGRVLKTDGKNAVELADNSTLILGEEKPIETAKTDNYDLQLFLGFDYKAEPEKDIAYFTKVSVYGKDAVINKFNSVLNSVRISNFRAEINNKIEQSLIKVRRYIKDVKELKNLSVENNNGILSEIERLTALKNKDIQDEAFLVRLESELTENKMQGTAFEREVNNKSCLEKLLMQAAAYTAESFDKANKTAVAMCGEADLLNTPENAEVYSTYLKLKRDNDIQFERNILIYNLNILEGDIALITENTRKLNEFADKMQQNVDGLKEKLNLNPPKELEKFYLKQLGKLRIKVFYASRKSTVLSRDKEIISDASQSLKSQIVSKAVINADKDAFISCEIPIYKSILRTEKRREIAENAINTDALLNYRKSFLNQLKKDKNAKKEKQYSEKCKTAENAYNHALEEKVKAETELSNLDDILSGIVGNDGAVYKLLSLAQIKDTKEPVKEQPAADGGKQSNNKNEVQQEKATELNNNVKPQISEHKIEQEEKDKQPEVQKKQEADYNDIKKDGVQSYRQQNRADNANYRGNNHDSYYGNGREQYPQNDGYYGNENPQNFTYNLSPKAEEDFSHYGNLRQEQPYIKPVSNNTSQNYPVAVEQLLQRINELEKLTRQLVAEKYSGTGLTGRAGIENKINQITAMRRNLRYIDSPKKAREFRNKIYSMALSFNEEELNDNVLSELVRRTMGEAEYLGERGFKKRISKGNYSKEDLMRLERIRSRRQ